MNIVRHILNSPGNRLRSLPIVILMPHSACNCRCMMCDIWKNNGHKQEWDETTVKKLLVNLKILKTRRVVMSGGEALMHPRLFDFCKLLKDNNIKITVLSSGLLLDRFAEQIIRFTDEVIVSLDGSKEIHDAVRGIPGGFDKIKKGVQSVKKLEKDFRIAGRCVIQKMNFTDWPTIIDAAHEIGFDQISFLAADISTHAFNHRGSFDAEQKNNIMLSIEELRNLKTILKTISANYKRDFDSKFIAETPDKLLRIYDYYAAWHDGGRHNSPPCNAPWVSAVVETDGHVRPCFFHASYGNIFEENLSNILNSSGAVQFRKDLDIENNPICQRCVCSLKLSSRTKIENWFARTAPFSQSVR